MTFGGKLGSSILPKHGLEIVQVTGNLDCTVLLDSLMDWGKVHITSDTQELLHVLWCLHS